MKLGAERKKVAVLVGLAGVAAYLLFTNSASDAPPQARQPAAEGRTAPAPAASPGPDISRPLPRPGRLPAARGVQEFRPTLKPKRPEERPDPASVDPTLRLELLARVREVASQGGLRSLFEFSQPPAPKAPEPKIVPPAVAAIKGAAPPKPAEDAAPPKPPPVPIPLKFYGYISPARQGAKRAFFLEGDEIYVAGEGDVIKKRYKVVRIGVNSVVMEDVEQKHQQTLPLEEQSG